MPAEAPLVGLSLQPEAEWLELLLPLVEAHCDVIEVTPETLWRFDPSGNPSPNGFYRRDLSLTRALGLPVIGHGVNLSIGTPDPRAPRFQAWLDALQRTHEDFDFLWYSDHFGQTTTADGEFVALPMPVPYSASRAALIRERLDRAAQVFPAVALETTSMPFWLADPALEPAMFHAVGHHILLDVHNLHVMSGLGGLDPRAYMAALPLERVIELHVSGGSYSDPEWLPSRRSWPLDSHDTAVPEPVWELLEHALARCPNVRAVILERRDGTVTAGDVPVLAGELLRIREAVARRQPVSVHGPTVPALPELGADDTQLGAALRQAPALPGVPEDLWRLTTLQVARLRWERLLNGSGALDAAYEAAPQRFVAAFRRYHEATPALATAPPAEVAAFTAFCLREGLGDALTA